MGLRPLWGPSVYYGCAISLIGLVMVRYNIIYTLVSYTISYESIKDESDIARRLILRKYNQLRSSKRSSWRWFLWRYVSVSAASFSTTVVRYISLVLCVLDAVFVFKTHQVSYRLMTFYLFDAYIEDNAEENWKQIEEDMNETILVIFRHREYG